MDSTYKISEDVYSLTVFTCVNKYGLTSILAICFHSEENAQNFGFALQSYINAGFRAPTVLFTDRSTALLKAVHDEWIQKKIIKYHFLCIYHIYRNIQQYMGKDLTIYTNSLNLNRRYTQ